MYLASGFCPVLAAKALLDKNLRCGFPISGIASQKTVFLVFSSENRLSVPKIFKNVAKKFYSYSIKGSARSKKKYA